ncbi:hypothetical protein [Candidatus Thiodubiliella endoseptemdiera]|uniref:hypothetical protein n=1 Tax=Candidatus Thiodubiliella endoseptemdiera TaxID=2738886 RepID=UPI0034DFA0E1
MTDKTEVSEQRCSVNGCDLEIYPPHEECILHCGKSTDGHHYQGFPSERDEFIKELKIYISKEKETVISKETVNTFIYLKNIYFPRPDYQGNNYIRLLDQIQQIYFDCCHFYGRELELKKEVFFDECKFHNKWSLFDYKLLKNADNVIYAHCTFEEDVVFESAEYKGINDLSQSQFNYYCKFEGQLKINNAIIKKNIFNDNQNNFLDNNFGSEIIFNGCTFEDNQELYLSYNDKTDFLFNDCYFGKKLKIRSVEEGDYEEQQNNKTKLKSLKLINCNADESDYLRIGFLEVENFELSNLRLPKNAELNIGDCHFKNFKLTNFRNIGKFKLYKINILKRKDIDETSNNEEFQIDNTSIGKTDFQSVKLDSFARVIMFDNIFPEVDYTNVQWEREIEVGQYGFEDIKVRVKNKESICKIAYEMFNSSTRIAKKRDTYRTLKNVMIRNNDQQEALVFYTQEMKEHRKITLKNNGLLSIDRITLAFNYWTNEFGLNWWRPVWLLIIFSIVFYGLLLCSFSDGYNSEYWQNFFEFLNPTHKTEFIAGECWGFWSYTIDFSFRIIEGLFIHQTIQAFRKYSRKL